MLTYPRHSICAFAYLQPASIPAPSIPREFADDVESMDISDDASKATASNSLVDRKFSPQVMNAVCDLCSVLYEVMIHNINRTASLGDEHDIQLRTALYARLQYWRQQLPPALDASVNFCAATCLLR